MRELLNLARLPFLLFCLIAAALSASAQEAGRSAPDPSGSTKAHSHIECSCRAQGRDHLVGTMICFETAAGLASFKCEMDQNVTSWRPQTTPCPTS